MAPVTVANIYTFLASICTISAILFIWTQAECDTIKSEADENETVTPVVVAADDTASSSTTSSIPTANPSTKYVYSKPIRKKDLSKIYAKFPNYTVNNTLIIDDTDAKLADHSDNHLCVEEFNVTDHEIDFTRDSKLLQLKKYLDKLVIENPEDVRIFLAKNRVEDF